MTTIPTSDTEVDVSWFREILHLLSNQGIGIVVMVFFLVVVWQLLRQLSPSIKENIESKSRLADKLGKAADNAPHLIERLVKGVETIAQAHDHRNRKDNPAE